VQVWITIILFLRRKLFKLFNNLFFSLSNQLYSLIFFILISAYILNHPRGVLILVIIVLKIFLCLLFFHGGDPVIIIIAAKPLGLHWGWILDFVYVVYNDHRLSLFPLVFFNRLHDHLPNAWVILLFEFRFYRVIMRQDFGVIPI